MLTADDRKQLAWFCGTCDSVANSRFIRTFFDQPHHIYVGALPDGRIVDEYPRYDDDDFRAFLTHYRKLRLKREPTFLFCIMNILKAKGDEADRQVLDYLRNEITEEGRCWWGATLRRPDGQTRLLTQEQVEDLVINGDVFHSDACKRDDLARVIGKTALPKALTFLNYMRFARTVLRCAQKTSDVIRKRGYLTE